MTKKMIEDSCGYDGENFIIALESSLKEGLVYLQNLIEEYGDNASADILSNGRLVFSVKFLRDVLGGASRAQQRVQNRSQWTPEDSKNIQNEINKIKATLGDKIVKTALGS